MIYRRRVPGGGEDGEEPPQVVAVACLALKRVPAAIEAEKADTNDPLVHPLQRPTALLASPERGRGGAHLVPVPSQPRGVVDARPRHPHGT